MNHETTIHLEWDGPLTLEDAKSSNTDGDWGIYQIYGCHPVYGTDVLLYIGKAEGQHFGKRLSQEWWWNYLPDVNETKIYLGRLAGERAPDDDTWNKHIDRAERLLIFAHRPAWNSQMNLGSLDQELQDVQVFNWGCHRSLLPELSGFRWTSRSHSMKNYHTFKNEEPRFQNGDALLS
jgi:hypothetical protein